MPLQQHNTAPNKHDRIRLKKVEVLFSQARVSIIAVQTAAMMFVSIFWEHANSDFLILWILIFSVINILRFSMLVAFAKSARKETRYARWENWFLVGVLLSGLMWGLLAIVTLPARDINFTAFTTLVISGLLGGAVSTYAINRKAYIIYATFSTLPLIVVLAIQNDPALQAFAFVIVVYFLFLLASMLSVHKIAGRSVDLQYENLDLIYQLEREKNYVEEINQSLEMEIKHQKEIEKRLLKEKDEAEIRVDEFSRLSMEDGLTKVMNRRGFNEFLDKEWNLAIKYQNSISLIMLDLDFFKPYNDYYGHPKGDEVLCEIARTCEKSVRAGMDACARYGGEEFVVILPKTELRQACIVADKLRDSIERLAIPHQKSRVARTVTASFGVATVVPTHTIDVKDLIRQADQALYSAKAKGRNFVYPCNSNDDANLG